MKKLLVVALIGMFLMPLAAFPAFATEKAVDAGNKLCPISGEPVSGTSFVEYQGKRYGTCCPGCKKAFLSDPAQYAAKASAPATSASETMEKDMEQGSL